MSIARGARRALRALVVIALATAAAVPFGGVAGASASSDVMRRLAVLPVDISTRFFVDDATNRFIGIRGEPGGPGSPKPLALTVFDRSTYKRLRTVEFPGLVNQGYVSGKPTVFAFDAKRRLLHVVAYHSFEEQLNSVNPVLATIDVDRFGVTERALGVAAPPGMRVLGMRLSEQGRLLLATQVQTGVIIADLPRATGAVAVEIDPASGSITWGPEPIRGCQALISSQSQAAVGLHDGTLYFGCATSTALFAPMPGVPAVIAMPTDSPRDVSISFLPGSYALGDLYTDEAAGRMLLVGSAPGRPAQAVWVFDLPRKLFLGQVAAGDLNVLASGVDPRTGRLYVGINDARGQGAILVGSDRGLAIAQAVSFKARSISGVIVPLLRGQDVIVPQLDEKGQPQYAVLRDPLPSSAIQPGAPVDFSEIDRTVTDTPQFSADTQAFGLRVHEIGGVNGAAQNVFPNSGINYWTETGGKTELRDGDRDLVYARIGRAHVGETDASAEAVESRADENTDHDVEKVRGSKLSVPGASCRDFGGGETSEEAGGAAVTCSQAHSRVDAIVSAAHVAHPLISVGETRAATRIAGAAAHAFAELTDVVIGDVRIGSVSSEAFAAAGTNAPPRYVRTFRHVKAGPYKCAEQCNVQDVVHAIARTLGAQFRVELPRSDVAVTPGRGHAHAWRDPWEHQEDVVINNQPVTELQVPALRIVYVADNASASRVLIELAATKADATSYPVRPACMCPPPPPPSPGVVVVPPVVGGTKYVIPPASRQNPPRTITTSTRIPGHGWKLLFPGSAGELARAAALWAVLLTPAVLAMRRRELSVVRRLRP